MSIKIVKRFYSNLKSPCLVRDFIYDRLYNPRFGYFCKKDIQIGELRNHIEFKSMIGYDDYKHFLFNNYPENAWLTPSELFRPWYGFTIANYIHRVIKQLKLDPKSNKIRIVEVGAGSGSALNSILVFFNNYEQALYNMLEYNVVEISPQMCQKTKEKFEKNHKKLLDRGNIRIINDDFLNYRVSPNSKEFTFIIFLEVLDNMPHDKVFYCPESKDWKFQGMVEFNDKNLVQKPKEIQFPINDVLISETVLLYKELLESGYEENEEKTILEKLIKKTFFQKNQKALFLPTYCLKMLKHLRDSVPNHHLIIADFDSLRSEQSSREGLNAPIVSKKLKKSHEKQDFENYLVKQGEADIFFPTNFYLLKNMYYEVCKKKSVFMKTHEFMNEFAKEKWAETRSGYNPLKEDFLNTSFLMTEI